ncbi:MAG: hypothetical protein DRN66_03315 [Candidatus Nanohalarchaeota archaeon]|nr:MAG: hypothetical protein DRN66_03315 [Candidatus Nanohaloarchaeota archaeon]
MKKIAGNLNAKRQYIEEALYRIMPKNITKEYLERYTNNNFYKYDKESIEKGLFAPMRELLERGGKHWRPYLYLLLLECFGMTEEQIKKYIDFSAIIEIIHNGTLLVDDIEDGAELRRGKPCVHKIYGNDVAINTGNTMYFLPMKLIKEMNVSGEQKTRICETYYDEMSNLSFGQAIDIFWHKNDKIPGREEYMQMCLCKTGALASMAARFACIVAGKTKAEEMLFGKAIGHLGVGFQIQDDILDIVSQDRTGFGKAYGNDITEGKKTLMVLHACETAYSKDREILMSILSEHTRDKSKINEAIGIIKKYNSVEFASEEAKKIAKSAWGQIDVFLEEGNAKKELKDFFDYLIEREI